MPAARGRPLRIALAVALSAALIGAVLIIFPDARREVALSFTRVEPGFTELYFGTRGVAETTAGDGSARVVVDVVLANRSAAADRYRMRIVVLDDAGAPVAERVQGLDVPAEQSRGSLLGLDLPDGADWSSVQVTLEGRPETIHYTARPAGEPEGP